MNLKGWEYEYESLPYWENHKEIFCTDEIFEAPHPADVACVIYSVAEVSMMNYLGFCAILSQKSQPVLQLSIVGMNFSPYAFFSSDGNYLFLKAHYRREKRFLLILNLAKKTYSVEHFAPPNLEYTLNEKSNDVFEVLFPQKVVESDSRLKRLHRKEITLKKRHWHPWRDLAEGRDLNLQRRSFFSRFQSKEKIWQESLELVAQGAISAQEFVDRNQSKVLFYSTPFGTGPNGKTVSYGMKNTALEGIYFPAFTTFEACHAHFTALQREGFLIIKGTLKGILSAMERDVLTHEWGVVIDPDSEFVAIPPTIRVTPKCLKY